jgi:hypothetical protein
VPPDRRAPRRRDPASPRSLAMPCLSEASSRWYGRAPSVPNDYPSTSISRFEKRAVPEYQHLAESLLQRQGVATERRNQARSRAGWSALEPGSDPLLHREEDIRMTRRCGPGWSLGGARERPTLPAAATTVSAAASPFLSACGRIVAYPMSDLEYVYELRQGEDVVATGRLSRAQPLELGERLSIGGAGGDRAHDRAKTRRAGAAAGRAAGARCCLARSVAEASTGGLAILWLSTSALSRAFWPDWQLRPGGHKAFAFHLFGIVSACSRTRRSPGC